jgi:glucosylglycerate synthase
MSAVAVGPELPPDVDRQLDGLPRAEVAVGILTYNNAATVPAVVDAIRGGLEKHLTGMPAVLINADAGSSDATVERLADSGLPFVRAHHEAPAAQLGAVPFHGVPGRGAAMRLAMGVARRLGVRALLVLEADVTSVTAEWIERLGRPVLDQGADLVMPVHARHRYDGTITNLVLAPLVGALLGRRLHQPLSGPRALSARMLERLATAPRWPEIGRSVTDLWMTGTAIADGLSIHEARLGRWRVESSTRTVDLPTMVAQTLGAVFAMMDEYEEFWLEVPTGPPVPADGPPMVPSNEPVQIDVERMVGAFARGLRDLGTIWEHVLAPDTLGDVLSLEAGDVERFRFPDDLWARVVYDFALGHHWSVVYRDHLLRSLVPLYLGRTAAFVLATRRDDAAAVEHALDGVATAFERGKTYLVDRWR